MNSTLCFCAAIFVHQVLKTSRSLASICKPDFMVDFLSGVHITKRRETNVMKWVISIILSNPHITILPYITKLLFNTYGTLCLRKYDQQSSNVQNANGFSFFPSHTGNAARSAPYKFYRSIIFNS